MMILRGCVAQSGRGTWLRTRRSGVRIPLRPLPRDPAARFGRPKQFAILFEIRPFRFPKPAIQHSSSFRMVVPPPAAFAPDRSGHTCARWESNPRRPGGSGRYLPLYDGRTKRLRVCRLRGAVQPHSPLSPALQFRFTDMANLPVERRGTPLQIRQLVIQVDEFRSVRVALPYGKDTALQCMMLSLQEPVLVDPRLHTFGHNLVGG